MSGLSGQRPFWILPFAATLAVFTLSLLNKAWASNAPGMQAEKGLHITLALIQQEAGGLRGISVTYDLSGFSGTPISLAFDTLKPILRRTTDQVIDLKAEDGTGALVFSNPIEIQNGASIDQVWKSTRQVKGTLHVSYVVPVATPHTSFRGPHIDLQAAGDGLSGAFVSFLLLPRWKGKLDIQLHWDLPPRQIAVASYGLGDTVREIDRSSLLNMFFLAGAVQSAFQRTASTSLSVYALGVDAPVFDEIEDLAMTLYVAERIAFHGSGNMPFRLLIRSYAGGPILSGRADARTFLLYVPAGTKPNHLALQSLIAHEMVHSLIRDLDDAPGEEGDWYTEGTADYFSIVLPWKAHIYDVCDYLELINEEAAIYYTNSRRAIPNDDLTSVMWSGRDAWTVPYARGAFYFADLEEKLVHHHAGPRVLDLVNEMSRRISSGASASNQTWRKVLADRVGVWALFDWDRIMTGDIIFPATAFGSPVEGSTFRTGFFNLGFVQPKRLDEGSEISGLEPDSAAARAGLLNGDVLTEGVDLNPFYRSFDKPLTLRVLRNEQIRSITFDPHLGTHRAMIWRPSSDAASAACRSSY